MKHALQFYIDGAWVEPSGKEGHRRFRRVNKPESMHFDNN